MSTPANTVPQIGTVGLGHVREYPPTAVPSDGDLSTYSRVVADSGESRWSVATAKEDAAPAEVLTAALHARFRSRQSHTFAEKMLSAVRAKSRALSTSARLRVGARPDSADP